MKKLFVILLAISSVTSAYADDMHGHGGERGGGGWGWGGWVFPALIGGAIVYDLTQPQPVYVQPAPVYLPGAAAASVQYWYFCAAANAYYPYIQSCPSGWQAVPTTPPAVSAYVPYGAPVR